MDHIELTFNHHHIQAAMTMTDELPVAIQYSPFLGVNPSSTPSIG